MSRSRRQAIFVDMYGSPSKRWFKREASKAVRKFRGEIPNGRMYKKFYCSWNISDYSFDNRWENWPKEHYHIRTINGRHYQNK